jgi:hypothetical protein
VPLAGSEPWDTLKADPRQWHFGFHQTPHVPAALMRGRERVYFREALYHRWTKNPAALAEEDAPLCPLVCDARAPLTVPMVLAGGDSAFGTLKPRIAEAFKTLGCAHVTVATIHNSAHDVADASSPRK